jgi:hypothetical protein
MPKSIDLLIGLTLVMLVASMAVTVMTGFVNHLSNLRGRSLRQGIADLLRLIDPDLAQPDKIAEALLKHPLIRAAENRMGSVIHREELTKLLMELAAGNGPRKLAREMQERLAATLKADGIDNPAATVDKIRAETLRIEKEHPQLSNMARANLAILQEAESHFVAKINTWFDQTMDRVSQRFTVSTRWVTFLCGVVLVAALQLDAIALINRIYVDDALRESLVVQARTQSDLYNFVVGQGVVPLPKYPADLARFKDARHLAGMMFTTLLLSLGAPFWYSALNQLLQLRPKIAQVDDLQRKARESAKGSSG